MHASSAGAVGHRRSTADAAGMYWKWVHLRLWWATLLGDSFVHAFATQVLDAVGQPCSNPAR